MGIVGAARRGVPHRQVHRAERHVRDAAPVVAQRAFHRLPHTPRRRDVLAEDLRAERTLQDRRRRGRHRPRLAPAYRSVRRGDGQQQRAARVEKAPRIAHRFGQLARHLVTVDADDAGRRLRLCSLGAFRSAWEGSRWARFVLQPWILHMVRYTLTGADRLSRIRDGRHGSTGPGTGPGRPRTHRRGAARGDRHGAHRGHTGAARDALPDRRRPGRARPDHCRAYHATALRARPGAGPARPRCAAADRPWPPRPAHHGCPRRQPRRNDQAGGARRNRSGDDRPFPFGQQRADVRKALAEQIARQDLSTHVDLFAEPRKGGAPYFYVRHKTELVATEVPLAQITA